MKIFPLSDLHIEFKEPKIKIPNVDVVVLAGDIGVGRNGIKWIRENIKEIPVIYVLGNHEYYGHNYPGLLQKLKEETHNTNITLLENEMLKLDNVLFYGATLWSDFEVFGNSWVAGHESEQVMTDFRRIRIEPNYSKIRYGDLIHIHQESINWLNDSLVRNAGHLNIVITHHAPSIKSSPAAYRNELVTAAFVSNLDNFIKLYKPHLWIHGHTHISSDYSIHGCRVVCNPFGYPGEDIGFNENLIIEI